MVRDRSTYECVVAASTGMVKDKSGKFTQEVDSQSHSRTYADESVR
jgi:hypothetical protein